LWRALLLRLPRNHQSFAGYDLETLVKLIHLSAMASHRCARDICQQDKPYRWRTAQAPAARLLCLRISEGAYKSSLVPQHTNSLFGFVVLDSSLRCLEVCNGQYARSPPELVRRENGYAGSPATCPYLTRDLFIVATLQTCLTLALTTTVSSPPSFRVSTTDMANAVQHDRVPEGSPISRQ